MQYFCFVTDMKVLVANNILHYFFSLLTYMKNINHLTVREQMERVPTLCFLLKFAICGNNIKDSDSDQSY